ncbi:MAG TPA: MATE family efflux transporter [Firmicutes bacterium]|nr:MATE family efflux transporter [Bacillota bacterium]
MSKTKGAEIDITNGVIWKQLLLFFFPILFGTFFQQLYNTVDAVVVGQFVGKEALAAVGGSTSVLINTFIGFFVGLSSGATVVISQFYGGGRHDKVSRAVHTAASLCLIMGAFFMIVGLIVAPYALLAMGTPEDIMGDSVTYLRIYFGGIIFPLIYNMGSGILRAVGDSKHPLYFLIICCITNLVLDVLFVAGFHWGVAGAAIATLISQAVSAVLILLSLGRTDQSYHFDPKQICLDIPILKDIIRVGLPAGFQSVLYSASNIIIQSSINTFGTNIVAAWTAYGKIDAMFWMIMSAFGTSITTFVGQNFGAQKYHRIRQSVRICFSIAMGATVLLSIILYFAGPYIYRLFTSDNTVITEGMKILRTLVPFYFTYVSIEIFAGAVRGTGDSILPMIITCFGVCALRAVWIMVAVPISHTIETVVLSYPITWGTTSLMFIVYYLQGGWLKRRIAKAGFAPEIRHSKTESTHV